MQPTMRSAAVRYALALVLVGLAVGARVLLTPWIGPESYPYVTIFAGIMGASVYAGFGPALVASFAAVVAVDWLFIPPRFTVFPVNISGWIGFVTALSMCTLIAMLAERMRRAEARVARADEVARSQVALQESEARLRAVVATVPTGIVSIDGEGCIRSFNRAAEGMFGYAVEEVLGQNVRVLMPSPDREAHDGSLARYRRTGVATIIGIGREVLGQRKDGSTFPLALTINDTVLHGEHLFTAVLRALTDEKAVQERERTLERRMLQYQRLADIGAVTARIAHDFGNPLAGLAMTAQAMLRRMESDAALPAQLVRPQTVHEERRMSRDEKLGAVRSRPALVRQLGQQPGVKMVFWLFDADKLRREGIVQESEIGKHLQGAVGSESREDWPVKGSVLDLEQKAAILHRLRVDLLEPGNSCREGPQDAVQALWMPFLEVLDDVGEVVAGLAEALLGTRLGLPARVVDR